MNNIYFNNNYGNSSQQEINDKNFRLNQNYDNINMYKQNVISNLPTLDKNSNFQQINNINNNDINSGEAQSNNYLPQNNEFKVKNLFIKKRNNF